MRRILQHIIPGTFAVLFSACAQDEIEVTDNSIPKEVTFSICKEEEEWEINTHRIVTIKLTPETAVPEKMGVTVSDEKVMEVTSGGFPMEYYLTAIAEGTVSVSVYADNLKSKEMTFKVKDSSIPQNVELNFDNAENVWELNTVRKVDFITKPEGTFAKKYAIEVTDKSIFAVTPTTEPDEFYVKAIATGKAGISGVADKRKTSNYDFEVVDSTVPQSVEMSIDNAAEKWEINSRRTVRISTFPKGTVAKSYGVISSDTNVLLVEPTQDKTEFTVKSIATGQASIYAYADELKTETKLFTVIDSSIPAGVSLSITDEAPEWQMGTIRRVIIHTSPTGTAAKQYNVVSSDSNVLKVISTEDSNVFDIEAVGVGQASIYATADNLQTGLLTFNIFNPDVKPEPEIKVYISKVGGTATKQDYGDRVKVNYGEQYIVSASCNRRDLTLELYSSNEKVAPFEKFGNDAWIVSAKFPGQTDLRIYVMDGDKEYFSGHGFVVYGEITLRAECSPVFSKAGFSVVDNPFGNLTADIYIDMTLVGWPYNDSKNQHRITIPPYEIRKFAITDDGNYPDLYDFEAASNEMYNTWTGGAINSGEHYTPHGAVLNYVFKFNNPYITVKMLDDKNGERNWEFYTLANARVEGFMEYE